MFRKANLFFALVATVLLTATNALSQPSGCNCANASLVGDTVGTRFNQGPGPINKVVGSGIELPGAGLGTVQVDLIVGMGKQQFPRFVNER